MSKRRCRDDAGMATVVVLGIATGFVAASALAVLLAGAVTARHRAGAAADLAAITAAQRWSDGSASACRAAAAIAAANRGRLVSCRVADGVSDVQVEVGLPGPFAHLAPARASARAGPASGVRYAR